MYRSGAAVVCVVLLIGVSSAVFASPFIRPPEWNVQDTDDWVLPFPYQRNAMIDFGTDPASWPLDPNGPSGSWDLLPTVNYDLEGLDDEELYGSDWFRIDGQYAWYQVDPFLGTRQGVIVFDNTGGNDPMLVSLTWHMDNWDWPNCEKNAWTELVLIGSNPQGDFELSTPPGYTVSNKYIVDPSPLPDGWYVINGYARIIPNPEWEEVTLRLLVTPGDWLAIDSWHTATECIPEPGTYALFGLGAAALVLWRRRRS